MPNPHWVPSLRKLTGLDEPVVRFFIKYPEVQQFIQQIDSMLEHWLPYLERNSRSYLTVALGCTGGQHRSVYIAEALGRKFRARGKNVTVKHNNMDHKLVKYPITYDKQGNPILSKNLVEEEQII